MPAYFIAARSCSAALLLPDRTSRSANHSSHLGKVVVACPPVETCPGNLGPVVIRTAVILQPRVVIASCLLQKQHLRGHVKRAALQG